MHLKTIGREHPEEQLKQKDPNAISRVKYSYKDTKWERREQSSELKNKPYLNKIFFSND